MGLLCCFLGDAADLQHGSHQQDDVDAQLTQVATSFGPGRRTPVSQLPTFPGSSGAVGHDEGVDEDRRSSPAISRNLLKLPAGAPRFSELYARLSHIRGSWHARGVAAMNVLSKQLGLQIATLWALSSDGAFFVVQASGGPRRGLLRPGASTPAALGDRQANSLQRVQASKTTTVYSCLDAPVLHTPPPDPNPHHRQAAPQPHSSTALGGAATNGALQGDTAAAGTAVMTSSDSLPHDLTELAAACGGALTDFAVLPLMSGGEVVGAVTLALHRSNLPPQRRTGRDVAPADSPQQPPSANPQQQPELPATAADTRPHPPAGRTTTAVAATPQHLPERSPPSLTDRLFRTLSRTAGGSNAAAAVERQGASSGVDAGAMRSGGAGSSPSRVPSLTTGGGGGSNCHRGKGDLAPAPTPSLPSHCWLQSAACVYQLGQLAHFLGYGFFSDTEQSSFVAQSCSLVSGVSSAPDVQTLVNCLIGMTKSLIYQRFRLQAQCLVALAHSSGATAAFFKQQRIPRGSNARTLAGGALLTVQARALSQREMSSQTRLHMIGLTGSVPTVAGWHGQAPQTQGTGAAPAASNNTIATANASALSGGGTEGGSGLLLQANYSNTSMGAGGGGGGGANGGGGSSSLHGLSAVLWGRKTRSQSQMKVMKSVPWQADNDALAVCVSDTMGTSVTATVISLSHTLLHDALHAHPPTGTAIRNCADAIARDAAPIRDITLACRLCDSRLGQGGGGGWQGEDSTANSGAFAGGGGGGGGGHSATGHAVFPHPHHPMAPNVSASPSMLRRSTCGRHAPLGSLVIALGLGMAAAGSGADSERTSCGAGGGGAGGLMDMRPASHVGDDDRSSYLQSLGGRGGPRFSLRASCGGLVGSAASVAEPYLALYVGFREVLQESVLERVLEEMTQVVELVTPSVQLRLLGTLRPEWLQMNIRLLAPPAFIGGQSQHMMTGLGLGLGGGGSRRGRRRSSHDWTEALGTVDLCASSTLSFALEDPAPLSHLQVLVNSFHSTLSSIAVERALEEAADSPVQASDMRALELLQQIGRGGQGVVYRGRMHGVPVAVKVIPTAEGGGGMGPVDRDVAFEPDNAEAARRAARRQRALLRDALEVAASAAVAHPHLVQLHTYFTDVMVVEYEGDEGRFRLMHLADTAPGDPTGAINLVLVLEYCDGGNLRQAMERGVFFRRDARLGVAPGALPSARAEAAGPAGAAAALAAAAELQPNFEFIYLTLLEVALAVRHMHSLRLAHCDLKPSNVLLRSAPHDPRGFTCKLSDFGCVQLLREVPGQGAPIATASPSTTGYYQHSLSPPAAAADGAAAATAVTSPQNAGAGQQPNLHLSPHHSAPNAASTTTATGPLTVGGGTAGGAVSAPGAAAGAAPWTPGVSTSGPGATAATAAGAGTLLPEAGGPQRLGFLSGHVLGTPSHLAPEAFTPGQVLDGSVDIYSFGMLMWEVLVGIPALAGLSAARVHSYTSRGLRPQFPPNTPDHYRNLAHACWAQDPRKRPTAAALVVALHKALLHVSPNAALEVRSMVLTHDPPAPTAAASTAPVAASASAASPSAAGTSFHHQSATHPHLHHSPYGPRNPPAVFDPDGAAPQLTHNLLSGSAPGRHPSPHSEPQGRHLPRPSSLGRYQRSVNSNIVVEAVCGLGGGGGPSGVAATGSGVAPTLVMPQTLMPSSPRRSLPMNGGGGASEARRRSLSAAYSGGGAQVSISGLGGLLGRGSAGGGSPLLLQLAQSRMSRSSRAPETFNTSPPAAASMPSSMPPIRLSSSLGLNGTDIHGPAPVVPVYGGGGGGLMHPAVAPLTRPGSNGGSISLSYGSGGHGGFTGGGGGGSGHVTEVCLATAADMVDVALVAAAAAAAAPLTRLGSGSEGRSATGFVLGGRGGSFFSDSSSALHHGGLGSAGSGASGVGSGGSRLGVVAAGQRAAQLLQQAPRQKAESGAGENDYDKNGGAGSSVPVRPDSGNAPPALATSDPGPGAVHRAIAGVIFDSQHLDGSGDGTFHSAANSNSVLMHSATPAASSSSSQLPTNATTTATSSSSRGGLPNMGMAVATMGSRAMSLSPSSGARHEAGPSSSLSAATAAAVAAASSSAGGVIGTL